MSRTIFFILLLGLCCACSGPEHSGSTESGDREFVTVYTTYGYQEDDQWVIPVKLWVHESPDLVPRTIVNAIKSRLIAEAGLESLSPEQEAIFERRAFGFIADNETGELPILRFVNDPESVDYQLPLDEEEGGTDSNGLSEGFLTLSAETAHALLAAQESSNGWLDLEVVSDEHEGRGRVRLIDPSGLSVVSDVDDTIKVTEIPAGHDRVLLNTFFREFEAAPCMPELYASLGPDVPFHYVSGGPWQLYQPISDFIRSAATGLPDGSFHMKSVRTNLFESESYEDIWRLIGSESEEQTFHQKIEQISTLLDRFPERRFLLVGDSGERDPEVFARVRELYPDQVSGIWIRHVLDSDAGASSRMTGMNIISSEFDSPDDCQKFVEEFAASVTLQ